MTLPGCSEEVVVFEEEVSGPAFARIEAALQEVWDAPMPPEFIVTHRHTGEQFQIVSEEARRLRQVTTPQGLARLFPALHLFKKTNPG